EDVALGAKRDRERPQERENADEADQEQYRVVQRDAETVSPRHRPAFRRRRAVLGCEISAGPKSALDHARVRSDAQSHGSALARVGEAEIEPSDRETENAHDESRGDRART